MRFKTDIGLSELDELVFEKRNKEYGSYYMRRKYAHTICFSFFLIFLIFSSVILFFFIKSTIENELNINLLSKKASYNVMELADIAPEKIEEEFPEKKPEIKLRKNDAFVAPQVTDSVVEMKEEAKKAVDLIPGKKDTTGVVSGKSQEGIVNEGDYVEVDEMPQFPGGKSALYAFITKNVTYPPSAAGSYGTVYIRFCVNKEGKVVNSHITKGVNPFLDSEAMRVMAKMPNWKPGKYRGNAIEVWFTVPFVFMPKG